jgi:P4 family phage/plasmid primase-like protien
MSISDDVLVREFGISDPLFFMKYAIYVKDQGCFYIWDKNVYRFLPDEEILKLLWNFLIEEKRNGTFIPSNLNISINRIRGLLEALKIDHIRRCQQTCNSYISFSDGKIMNMENFEIVDASPDIHSFFRINAPSSVINESPDCPRFKMFLKEILVLEDGVTPDEGLIDFVQDLFGYCLLGSIKAHATFFFLGSGRNGKSVLLNVLRELIGSSYISNMTIQTLTTSTYASANLVGKKVNIASEEESKHIRSDVFKGMIAGDPMTVEQKYKAPIEIIPAVKFLFATNQMPVFDSTDPAIRERVFVIPFNRYFTDDERDPELTETLKSEIGGIFGWALEGAKRIIKNKYKFRIPESIKVAKQKFSEEQSSVLTFLTENYVITGIEEDYVIKAEMFARYKDWCFENKRQSKANMNFYKDINNIHRDKVKTEAKRSIDGREIRVVKGIKKTEDESAFVNYPIQYLPPGSDR